MPLAHPTQDTRLLAHAADAGLSRLYRPGFRYQKAGVMLLELAPPGTTQTDLFAADQPQQDSPKSRKLMRVPDTVNQTLGRSTLFLAGQGGKGRKRRWHLRAALRSPRYTTSWAELARVG